MKTFQKTLELLHRARTDGKAGKRKRGGGSRGEGGRKRSHMASPVPGPHVPGAVLRMDQWPRACDAHGSFVPGEVQRLQPRWHPDVHARMQCSGDVSFTFCHAPPIP